MHVFGDVLSMLLSFSLRSGCQRDYNRPCPDRWVEISEERCQAPFWYFGHCHHVSVFHGYTPDMKVHSFGSV